MHLGIALTPRSPAALAAYATAASTPGAPGFARRLTPAEFRGRFGPTAAAVRAVEQSMRADGFRLGGLSANGLLLQVSAPVAAVEGAFGVRLRSYALSSGGRGWAASAAPLLPRLISPDVTAVLGLNQLVSVRPLLVRPARAASGAGRIFRGAVVGTHACTACRSRRAAALRRGDGWRPLLWRVDR
jgi:subtilase family serine protease